MKKMVAAVFVVVCMTIMLVSCTTTGHRPAASKPAAATPAPATEGNPTSTGKNLALGKTAKSNNHIYEFTADKAVDGDVNTYYEGAAKNYPNDLIVDLGMTKNVHRIALKLNPKRIWSARTQTFEVFVSDDGENFTSVVASKPYDFSPTEGQNSVKLDFEGTGRYLKVQFTANTESNGGQVAELEVYGD